MLVPSKTNTKPFFNKFATESFMDKATGQEDFLPWSVLVNVVCDKHFLLLITLS